MKKILCFLFLVLNLFLIIGCGNPEEICTHDNKEWIISKEATCLEVGTKKQQCVECKKVFTTAIIPLTEHVVTSDEAVDATCEEDGLTEGSSCKICGTVFVEQKVIEKMGHHFIFSKELSNNEINVYVCDFCDERKENNRGEEECENHIADDKWILIEDSTCSKTGVEQKKCIICDFVMEDRVVLKKEHIEVTVDGVEAKCEETGLTEGSYCDVCNTVIKKQEVIEATGHQYSATNTVYPTEDMKGYIEYTCSLCQDSYQKELAIIGNYNPSEPTIILLEDNGTIVTNNNGGVIVDGNTIQITLPGEYDLSGKLSDGSIKVTLLETELATLNLQGVNITSTTADPIYIESGDEIDISANSGSENYIYDKRVATDINAVGAAIYAKTDLDIKGKGSLYIESTYNNGIGTTKDLKIKNLNLEVNTPNNALKGNDSITIESGIIKAISSSGDALKTEHSDVSTNGKQRGIIHIIDGEIDLYAACDGIDASYQVLIDGGKINIYTEKYSDYSGDVSVTQSSTLYLRVSSRSGISANNYTYSALYKDELGQETWVKGVQDTNNMSRYYKFDVPTSAKYVKYYAYSSTQTPNQSATYSYTSDQLTIPSAYDTYYVTMVSGNLMNGDWTNYTAGNTGGGNRPGGGMGGGPQEGNPESAAYSCKGIKSDNEIIINGGIINISSHDDGIHTNSDVLLETGLYGKANIDINGGIMSITTDDDGLHADGVLTISGGEVVIIKSYEGIEGNNIYFKGGKTQIKSSDDGINAKTTLYFQDGVVYLDANGDGIDSNGSVYMSGGIVFALGPTNGGNGVIDIGDRGYTFSFTGGLLLAIGCSGMDVSPTGASGNTVSTSRITSSLNSYLTITVGNEVVAVMKVTKSNQTYRVFAYNNTSYPSAKLSSSTTTDKDLINGLYYVKQ